MSELGEIASQFLLDAQVILGKDYNRYDIEETVRWLSWHLDSEAQCSDERMRPLAELQAKHKAHDYIELIHYMADIVQCPHPRYKNKVKEHFAERHKRHEERSEIYIRQSRENR